MPQETPDEVMDFIRTGRSPATTVRRKMAEILSTARRGVYDSLGPVFESYVPKDDPRRTQPGMQLDPWVEANRGVRSLSVTDMPGFDLFDPSPVGEIKLATQGFSGIPRKAKEVFALLERFKIEGWNRGQVVDELRRLGHAPEEFADAIASQFTKGSLLDAPPASMTPGKGPLEGPVDESFGLAEREAMDFRNRSREASRNMQAPPDEWAAHVDTATSFRKMGDVRAAEEARQPTLGGIPLTVSQRMRSAGGTKAPTFAGTWKNDKGEKLFDQYNLQEDIVDPLTGQVKHAAGSTVSENTLKLYGLKADPRRAERLPDDFERQLMRTDPDYVGGAAKRQGTGLSELDYQINRNTPRAGARASNNDTVRDSLNEWHERIQNAEGGISNPIDDAYIKVGEDQRNFVDQFLDMIQDTDMAVDDMLRELGNGGANRQTQRRLKDLWDRLSGD